MLSTSFNKDMTMAGHMAGVGERSSIYNLLKSSDECTDRGWLLLLLLG
jgi:hypothetical protein